MDSKLKRTAVLLSVLTGITIVAVVVAANWKSIVGRPSAPKEITSSVQEDVPSDASSLFIGNNPNAWRTDEKFFDSEADTLAMQILENSISLDLKCVSVERDLRVRILDYQGDVKTGEKFSVKIKAVSGKGVGSEYTLEDDDMDGVLYQSGLAAGTYTAVIVPLEGYITETEPVSVEVKDKAECAKIEDIELLFTTKTDAETAIDDLGVMSALDYADKKQATSLKDLEDVSFGIDISSATGEVDWEQVYNSGIRFVMLRAGYRGAVTGDIVIDDSFYVNAKNAIRSGLDVGAYFFSQAVNEKEAIEEASAVLELSKNVTLTYPVCIRVDRAGGLGRADSLDSEARTDIVSAFCNTIKNEGYTPCVYASSNWLNTNLEAKKLEKYDIWMAEFTKNPGYEGVYDYWQYTFAGKISGINGPVNLSISYK